MSKNKVFQYTVDFNHEIIKISKAFSTAAANPKNDAHNQLMRLREAFPGFGISVNETTISASKQTYRKLNYDAMREHIIEADSEDSPNLLTLNNAIQNKVPYPKVKQWYLRIYGDHYKRVTEVVEVGNTEAAAASC